MSLRRSVLCLGLLAGCRTAPPPVDGAALFGAACSRCHGLSGGGGPPLDSGVAPRNFREPAFHDQMADAQLRRTIVEGKGAAMPAFGITFNEAQLDALVRHVRSFDPRRKGP
jgi:mono/diheme cytochrome c family protein